MSKFAVIPTRSSPKKNSEAYKVYTYLKEAGYDTHFSIGEDSIFSIIDAFIKKHKIVAKDTLIVCHDDIEILTSIEDFNSKIDSYLAELAVGFIGVAGTKKLMWHACWWAEAGDKSSLSGNVFQGDSQKNMYQRPFGPFGTVEILDGLFLAAKGSTWNSIQISKPKSFEGAWDFYDIFWTYQATRKVFLNKTIDLPIRHSSIGEIAGRKSWHDNRRAFIDIFSQTLWHSPPANIRPS